MPLHVLLYRAFGWDAPEHLPLILKPVGNGKLSKRDGDKLGFPVFPLGGKLKKVFHPAEKRIQAVVNFGLIGLE
jgi:glutamyl-tRNA synthetase